MNFPCCDLIYWDWAIFYRTCWPPFPDCQKCVNAILFWNCFNFSVLLNCFTRQNLKEINFLSGTKHILRTFRIYAIFCCLSLGWWFYCQYLSNQLFVCCFYCHVTVVQQYQDTPKIIRTELFMFFLQNLWASQKKTPQKHCQFKRSSFQR